MHKRSQTRSEQAVGPFGGRIRLNSRIGSGRLGLIYAADDTGVPELAPDRSVALQIIGMHRIADTSMVEQLRLGFAALGAHPHPNIVRFLDFESVECACFVLMELLEGVSARFVLNDGGSLPAEEAFPIVRAVGDALQFLHARSIVHGKLTPENVFITADYDVKLLDIVPAQKAKSGSGDGCEDVFGLACLTYELLSGRHPFFNGCTDADARRAGLEPRPLDSVPGKLWEALARALSLDPDRRPPSIAELLDELGVDGTERLGAVQHTVSEESRVDEPEFADEGEAQAIGSAAEAAMRATSEYAPRYSRVWTRKRRRSGRGVRSVAIFSISISVGVLVAFGVYNRPWLATDAGSTDAIDPEDSASPLAMVDSARPPASEQGLMNRDPSDVMAGRERSGDLSAGIVTRSGPTADAATPDGEPQIEPQIERQIESQVEPKVEPKIEPQVEPQVEPERAPVDSGEPSFAFARTHKVTREDEVYASLTIERSGALAASAPIMWWTQPQSADSGGDFLDLGESTETFATGENARTVYVPIVNDGIREETETFFVHIGILDPITGMLESQASTQVDIVDDD